MSDDKGLGLRGWLTGQKSKPTPTENKIETISLEKNRVAVLPLVNMIADPADEYFSDGMTEELISSLATISGLHVISRTSIMQYKNTNKKIAEIGRDLAAGSIIEGSVRKAGNQLRITIQLIDTQQDKHLWSQTYDREMKDVFAMQSDIARHISEVLRVKLLPSESAQLRKIATNNIEAYTLYLKGRYHWNKRTEDGVKKAIEYFQSAIDLDSNYALAYAGLADCYNIQTEYRYELREEASPRAKKASLRALELDDGLAEAHASLALCMEMDDWNWKASETEFKPAIELSPNYASAHQWYSILLRILRRQEEAFIEIRKAQEIDPLSPIITQNVGIMFEALGQYDSAIEQFKKALEIEPDFIVAHEGMVNVFVEMSRFEEALEEWRKVDSLRHSDLYSQGYYVYVRARSGKKDELVKFLENNIKEIEIKRLPPLDVASLYSLLGDKENALLWLMKGYEWHDPTLPYINEIRASDPFFALRSDSRFIDLLKKVGLKK